MRLANLILLIFITFFLRGAEFIKLEPQNENTRVKFDVGNVEYDPISKRIESPNNSDDEENPPSGSYSFLYNFNGQIEVSIESSQTIVVDNDIHLFDEVPPLLEVTEYGTMRGARIFAVTINPLQIEDGKMILYNQVNLSINENDELMTHFIDERNYSRAFNNLLENFTINGARDLGINYQQPAILYITGGNSGNLNSFDALVKWRKQQGFKVYTASVSETGSSLSQIKGYIESAYFNYDPAPEFVCLVGDVGGNYNINTYFENLSGYGGEGDLPFSQIEGDDLLPEVIVGRLSVRNSTHMSTVVNKIFNYEKAVYTEEAWFDRAALIGDPDNSGYSVIITNEYIKQTMENYGVEDVRTNLDGGNEANWMVTQLNDGVGYLNYRGYYGVSGFTNNHVENLNNGPMLPFATIITCGTGSFADESGSAMSEVFLRAGSTAFTRGAVAAIGTATIGTHTAYNNILDMGVYYGIFAGGAKTTGEALAAGKLALLETYPQDPFNKVTIFTHWNNLMGDPAIPLWTKTPVQLTANEPESILPGSHNITIEINDTNGNPIQNARVTLLDENGTSLFNKLSGENGEVQLIFDYVGSGPLDFTVTAQDKIPYEYEIQVEAETPALILNSDGISVQDDYNGNGNSIVNPGEDALLFIPIQNYGSAESGELSCLLTSEHSQIVVNDGENVHINIDPGIESFLGPFSFSSGYNLTENEELPFTLHLENQNGDSWTMAILLIAEAPFIRLADESNYLTPQIVPAGQGSTIELDYVNIGSVSISNLIIQPLSTENGITVVNGQSSFLEISPGQTVTSNPFTLHIPSSIMNGTQFLLPISISSESGYSQIDYYYFQVGEVDINDPLGPDQFGYYIFGDEDVSYEIVPEFNWIEIDPYYGGNGIDLGFLDYGDGEPSSGNTSVVPLPFEFGFYGIDYNEITVSSNGWIAFGENALASFRNYPIPGPGGPSPMIAAFWDDLKTTNTACEAGYVEDCSGDGDCCPSNWIGDGYADCEDQPWGCDLTCYDNDGGDCDGDLGGNGQGYHDISQVIQATRDEEGGVVLTYHDTENNRFIIEWSDMKTYDQNDDEDFQVILIPQDGDGDILIQYKTFNNTSVGEYGTYTPTHGQYATIGIENQFQDDGLQYTYNNNYPPAAGIIDDGSVLLITPNYEGNSYQLPGDLNFDSQLNVADVVLMVGVILNSISYTDEMFAAGDINMDNELNITDVVILVNIILDTH